jgi:hypothetical protein
MATYPISIPRKSYQGSDPKKQRRVNEQNRIAAELEKYINAQIKDHGGGSYLYSSISYETGYDIETVRKLCFAIDCGHNGFTVAEPENNADFR